MPYGHDPDRPAHDWMAGTVRPDNGLTAVRQLGKFRNRAPGLRILFKAASGSLRLVAEFPGGRRAVLPDVLQPFQELPSSRRRGL